MSFFTRNNTSNNSKRSNIAYSEVETPSSHYRSSVMYKRDWRSALRTPPTYRIGNRTVRFNFHFALLFFAICAFCFLFFYVRTVSTSSSEAGWLQIYVSSTSSPHGGGAVGSGNSYLHSTNDGNNDALSYNTKYPLTPPFVGRGGVVTYRIAMVADLDTNSKFVKDDGSIVWRSYLKKGHLSYAGSKRDIKIKWDDGDPITLESSFSVKGRGMELSELITFDGKLLTFDDRTGLIYEITNDKAIPWIILLDGNGRSTKGFKSEWATVKQQTLYVGSMGKEWTTSLGDFQNEDPMYVKTVTADGQVKSLNWAFNFKLLRQEAMQITWPGYMIHESGVWSEIQKKWYFLPRRCSKEKYNETRDEHMGCNLLISADERFSKFKTITLDSSNTASTHGFSSFKFIPDTNDHIILAIKSQELNGKTATFVTAFDIEGKTLMPEQRIGTDYKYEGIEFV